MAYRYVEVVLPADRGPELEELLDGLPDDLPIVDRWSTETGDGRLLARVLVRVDVSQEVIDRIAADLGSEDCRVVLLEVEATTPVPEEDEAEEVTVEEPSEGEDDRWRPRIGRDELRADLTDQLGPSADYVSLVVLSSVVAAVGLLRGDEAILIGAMVIAPLIGPIVALAFATSIGDVDLVRRATLANAVGVGAVLAFTVPLGRLFPIDLSVASVISRTLVGWGDVALALAAGIAGVMSYTRGVSTSLIGVMVAAALLPPLVATGMLVGAGTWRAAFGAGLLTLTNFICLNLAAVVTFLVQGVRPRTWWERDRARRASRVALLLWTLMLVALLVAIYFASPVLRGLAP